MASTNQPINIEFVWELAGAELDNLSRLINGKLSKINEDEITDFLGGVLDGLIMIPDNHLDKRALARLHYEQQGKSIREVESYLRGWDSANSLAGGKK